MALSKGWREFLKLLNSRGVDYVIVGAHEALATKVPAILDAIPVFILNKDALIRIKRAVGRLQDVADLDSLEG